ncbi:MAG: tRNA preQ1(34) S-adenosylmethionine ribosyltransferase-isomerase QueA [Armatimonadetes bacterium]|nr:tRNA preQ1(34) S-adenosylmethionine ribosyltransferase-isomerase QueA [Armatimonadota bacterium]
MDELAPFDYVLPPERIAQRPLEPRDASKLLYLNRKTGQVRHLTFRDCLDLLEPGDLLVANNTRVTAKRLFGRRKTGAQVEALLLRPYAADEFECLLRPGGRIRQGESLEFEEGLNGEVLDPPGKAMRKIRLSAAASKVSDLLERVGRVPLPPYIHEKLADPERYQTTYSVHGGSAAAPTAGLHFTPELMAAIKAKGVNMSFVTLNVGVDTFKPVEATNLSDHVMHGETCQVGADTAQAVANCKGRIIAVGTTSVRTLETFAIGKRHLATGERVSTLFIQPGFEFKIVDGMFTNFHMPRTTMLIMLAAMAGVEPVMNAYKEALTKDYRFLSFGDSMLIL